MIHAAQPVPSVPWTEPASPDTAAAPDARPAADAGGLYLIDELLRDRGAILARIRRGVGLADLVRAMLVTIAASCAIFGAVLGLYRGGVQIAYAAIKVPMVVLLTAALCAPCLTAFNAALDRPFALRRDLALMLVSLAMGSLLLVAQAPLLLLCAVVGAGYHTSILVVFGCAAVAGLGSLVVFVRGVRAQAPRRAGSAALALVLVVAAVGAQMGWTLRPYLVRPRTPEVPFVRGIEGGLLDAVRTSVDSAQGQYHRSLAPLPGGDAR